MSLSCLDLCAKEGDALLAWLRRESFAGFDPFDALESRLFGRSPMARWPLARLAWIQLFKRIPVNLRPLVGVPRLRNPKTLGLALTGLARRAVARGQVETLVGGELVGWLAECQEPNSGGWGYPFAWQNRAFYAPQHQPNAVCSAFVVHGLLDYSEAANDERAFELATSALPFFHEKLGRTAQGESICFSYTALDGTQIHNVNLLVASALARLGRLTSAPKLLRLAQEAVRYSIDRQRPDGSWPYGEGRSQEWIDGFHTGFNLSALRWLAQLLESDEASTARRKGFEFFQRRLLDEHGLPKYYDRTRYPLDAHSCAQAIVTMVESADLDPSALVAACMILEWTRDTLGRGSGRYAYQRWRLIFKPIVYPRWSQAWMFRAVSELEAGLCRVTRTTSSGPATSRP